MLDLVLALVPSHGVRKANALISRFEARCKPRRRRDLGKDVTDRMDMEM